MSQTFTEGEFYLRLSNKSNTFDVQMPSENSQLLRYTLTLLIIIAAIYIGNQINFFNNDDWVYYKTVENFLRNDFSLHSYVGTTFYIQGFLAYFFAKLFGISKLPILTILVSITNLFIFYKILNLISKRNRFLKAITILLLVLNPLYLYSSIGFMTENYVVLFLLLAVYFQIKFQNTNKLADLLLSNVAIILGFFVKQYSILLAIGIIISLAIKKKWKPLILYSSITLILLLFYFFVFPKNEVFMKQTISPEKLFDLNGSLKLLLTIFLYLNFFTIPLSLIVSYNLKGNKVLTFGLSLIIFVIYLRFLSAGDFPSLTNVLTQKGLLPDIDGNKSQWIGYYKFFTYTFYLSAEISSIALSKIILNIKEIFTRNKFLVTSFCLYSGLYLVLPIFYDRYLLPLFIIWVLVLYKSIKISRTPKPFIIISVLWLIVYGFFNYLYTSDLITRNIAVETSTKELINSGINPKKILANRGWYNYYDEHSEDGKYIFSYDNPEVFDGYVGSALEKTIPVNFPLNIFTSKEIYLYKIQE